MTECAGEHGAVRPRLKAEVIESTAVEETGTELATYEEQPLAHPTLFGGEPGHAIERMTTIANAFTDVLRQRKLVQEINIGGQKSEHVKVEGWTLVASLVGVAAVPVSCVELRDEDGKLLGFEAYAEARTLDQRVVGAATARCMFAEKFWKRADEYAVQSMAQTRAIGKALRGPLGFLVNLAGYEATPAEEMTFAEDASQASVTRRTAAPAKSEFDRLRDELKARAADWAASLPEEDRPDQAEIFGAFLAAFGIQLPEGKPTVDQLRDMLDTIDSTPF